MQFSSSPTTKYTSSSKRLIIWAAAFILFIIGIFIYSETAHAGLISYVQTVFGGSKVSAKVIHKQPHVGSQNLAILQPAVSFDPNPEKASDVSPIVGNTLVADIMWSESVVDTTSTKISSYVVREGDTVSSIAKMFGVSVNTVIWANNINRTSVLPVGQNLVILPIIGINYTVQRGDTIKGIVLKYKADLDEVLRYNDLTLQSTLVTGQTILIPDVELQTPVVAKPQAKGYVRDNRAHDTNGPDYGSYYMRPCDIDLCRHSQNLHGYNGVDLAGPSGTKLYASAGGTVIVSRMGGWNGGYGNYVIISHDNGTQTVYGHMLKTLVSAGQHVDRGQVIGLVGNTGNSTGPHVHFEIRGGKNSF